MTFAIFPLKALLRWKTSHYLKHAGPFPVLIDSKSTVSSLHVYCIQLILLSMTEQYLILLDTSLTSLGFLVE